MYRPPAFREDRPEVLHDMMRAHPLATLVTYGTSGLTANLLPFALANDGNQDVLRAHLAKANPQLEDLRAGAEALVIFQGPHAYVTPSWYPTKQEHGMVVPTWNYVVVQAWGRPQLIGDAPWLLAQVEALTDRQEAALAEPWSVSDAPPAFVAGQLKGIIGLEVPIARIEGKWKASQNQPPANRAGVAGGLRALDPGSSMAIIVEQASQRD